jgi:2-polyprenyl-3-methyl-5-hydroxy-6-metoxy-1,4-benzoquinol methylase
MDETTIQRIREQFNFAPYPKTPVEQKPDRNKLFRYNMVNGFYLRDQQVVSSQGKSILDVGCGSGFTTLALALANPGAKIVAIDISETSIELAQSRLLYHGFPEVEFHVLPVEQLDTLNRKFDYINCDETLYLLPDPLAGLQAMARVLAERGIIRANLHHALQRRVYFQAQEVMQFLGFMDDCEQETALKALRDLFNGLGMHVWIKNFGWSSDRKDEDILENHLLRGDRGFRVKDMFDLIAGSGLQFISLVDHAFWRIADLFTSPEAIPDFIEMAEAMATPQERLYLYELLNPVHRLLDFYCGHAHIPNSFRDPAEWQEQEWYNAKAWLHPQLQDGEVRAGLEQAISALAPCAMSPYLTVTSPKEISLLPPSRLMLYILLTEGKGQGMDFPQLVQLWQNTFPHNPLSRTPMTPAQTAQQVRRILIDLEELQFIFLTL